MLSLFFYIITFFISIRCAYIVEMKYKKNHNRISILIFTVITLSIPIIISSIRYGVGTDFFTYEALYRRYCDIPFMQIFSADIEIGFVLIAKIAYIFNNKQIVFAIYAILTVVFIWLGILNKKEKISISLCFFLYLFLNFTSSFNGIRQALAVAIVAYSYKYLCNRKFLKFLIFNIIASMFHTTALFFIPFYFIFQKNANKKINICIKTFVILLLMILIVNFENIFKFITSYNIFDKYSNYINYENETNNLIIFVKIFILCFISIYKNKIVKYDKDNDTYYFLLIIDVMLTILGFQSPYLKRITTYFSISTIFLLPSIPKVIENKKEKQLITLGIMGYALAMFIITAYILGHSDVIPYNTIFNRESIR